jgi:hypothetical protein
MGALAGFLPSRDDLARRHSTARRAPTWPAPRSAACGSWRNCCTGVRAVDAIVRALYRTGVSRRHLLQWTTAATAQAMASTGLVGAAADPLEPAGGGPAAACRIAGCRHAAPRMATALCLLWAASPLWTWFAAGPGRHASRRHCRHPFRPTWKACARHLALLRALCHRRRQPPAARQPADRCRTNGGAPHLAHQHRPVPAQRGLRPRVRLDRHAGPAGPDGRHAGHAGAAAAPPRPFHELVRHADLCPPAADVRLHRGQRQPHRPPAGGGAGLPGAGPGPERHRRDAPRHRGIDPAPGRASPCTRHVPARRRDRPAARAERPAEQLRAGRRGLRPPAGAGPAGVRRSGATRRGQRRAGSAHSRRRSRLAAGRSPPDPAQRLARCAGAPAAGQRRPARRRSPARAGRRFRSAGLAGGLRVPARRTPAPVPHRLPGCRAAARCGLL